jgi:hypothetical protein
VDQQIHRRHLGGTIGPIAARAAPSHASGSTRVPCTRAPRRVEGSCIRYPDMDSNRRATKKPSQVSAGDVWRRDKKIAPEDGM